MRSSYIENKYGNVLKTISYLQNPKLVVEFGILDGYSLDIFVNTVSDDCEIHAYDMFDEFPGNTSNYDEIMGKFSDRVKISSLDFYEAHKTYEDNSIDLLHVDIANDGVTYEFVFDNYLQKISNDGLIILEGGSIERDNLEWMKRYNKKKMNSIVNKYKNIYYILELHEDYPSMTLIKKNKMNKNEK